MNFADYGGGAYMFKGGSIINSTIVGNNATISGGGVVCTNGGSIINSIIYNNQALFGDDNWLNYLSGATFNYCCTTPTNGLPIGNKCIPDNPMFVNPGSDYTLLDGSPCIDAGFNMVWMNPPATDLEGNERIHDGIVDIGCYEFIPEPFDLSFIICCLIFMKFRFKLRLRL